MAALRNWELSGRLVVRQDGNTDTVNINWRQQDDDFNLVLSGSLGLGAVRVRGNAAEVTVEKAGDEPVTLPSLADVSREFFGYEFPTAELLYWVRGLPAPELSGSHTFDANRMLATLQQQDMNGVVWNLTFDRYAALEGSVNMTYLPGRIVAQREGLELMFLINDWIVPE